MNSLSQHGHLRIVACLTLTAAFAIVDSSALAARSCRGARATIVGTNKAERLRGTKGRDVILGLGGGDRISGRGGNDVICGGGGHDQIRAGGGRDRVYGQSGDDALFGGPGNDTLTFNEGLFQFGIGGTGDDRIVGNQNFVFVSYAGAPSGVTVDLGQGTASGGHGSDTLIDVTAVQGSKHDDTLSGDTGSNFLFAAKGNDDISTGGNSGGFDEVVASEGPQQINAFEFDFVGGGAGDDTITGGEGIQVVDYSGADEGVDVNLQGGRATGQGTDDLSGINVVIGSFFADTLNGDDGDNAFEGLGGADVIDGKAGEDVAIYFDANSGVTVDLAAGTAEAEYVRRTRAGPIADMSTDTLRSIEGVWGSMHADTIAGDDVANLLAGFGGPDDLDGAGGDDRLIGGDGDDTADGGDGTDSCSAENEVNCET